MAEIRATFRMSGQPLIEEVYLKTSPDETTPKISSDDGRFPEGESSIQTINDILSFPEINIPFDDNMHGLCEEMEKLTDEELFGKIAEITKIYSYQFDLRSYWLIDIIAGFLLSGKKEGLSSEKLWAMLKWFMFIFIRFRENYWTHESLLQHIQSVSLASVQEVKMRGQSNNSEDSPPPTLTGFQREGLIQTSKLKQKRGNKKMSSISSMDTLSQPSKGNKRHRRSMKITISKHEVLYTLEDLIIIANIFYDLFATPFQFKILQWSLLDLDQVIILEFPYPINVPRDLKAPSIPIPQEPIKSGSAEEVTLKGKDKKSKKKNKDRSEETKTKETGSQPGDEKSKAKDKKSKKKKKGQSEADKMNEQSAIQPDGRNSIEEDTSPNWEVDDNVYILPLQEAIGIGKDFFSALFPEAEEESADIKKMNKKQGKKDKKRK